MSRFATLLLTIFAAASVASCSKTAPAGDVSGSGFEALHPSAETRRFIVANDLPFAREVVAHNEQCARLSGCAK